MNMGGVGQKQCHGGTGGSVSCWMVAAWAKAGRSLLMGEVGGDVRSTFPLPGVLWFCSCKLLACFYCLSRVGSPGGSQEPIIIDHLGFLLNLYVLPRDS